MKTNGDWIVEGKDFITELKEGKYLWLSQQGINNVIKEIERLENIIKIIEKRYKSILIGHMGLFDEEASEYIKEEIKEGLEEICNDNK